jgi:hypothetical protein
MTNIYNTEIDNLLLQTCKDYMLITETSPSDFADELMNLASQVCECHGTTLKKQFLELAKTS